jgi:hypothetical protein
VPSDSLPVPFLSLTHFLPPFRSPPRTPFLFLPPQGTTFRTLLQANPGSIFTAGNGWPYTSKTVTVSDISFRDAQGRTGAQVSVKS